MKRTLLMLAAAICVSAVGSNAQDKPADGQRRPGNPIIAALDANGDGTIDATEISNAPAALRKLDKNGDGKLTREELRPAGRGEGQGRGEGRRNRQNNSDKK